MDYLPIFIAITAAAVVIQAGILVALYLAVRQTLGAHGSAGHRGHHQGSANDRDRALHAGGVPAAAPEFSHESQRIEHQGSRTNRAFGCHCGDAMDRTRLQVIRADELLHRTLDRVENTTDLVHKTVVSPVRQTGTDWCRE